MSIVNKIEIDTSLMPNGETARMLTVTAKKNSEFNIIALQADTLKYYDFETDTFTLGHAPKNNLTVKMNSKMFRYSFSFPSGSGTYVIKVLTKEGTTTSKKTSVLSRTIEKQGTPATITFTPATINSIENFSTFPTSTSSGNVSDGGFVEYSWTLNNASTDAGGFGLVFSDDRILGDFFLKDDYYYTEAEEAIVSNPAGDGEDSTKVVVADLTGLAVNMELYYHKSSVTPRTKAGVVYATGDVKIQSIDTANKIITFNTQVAFEDTETMKFRAYGSKVIKNSTGADISFGAVTVSAPTLTTTVRGDVSGTTINLTNTHGISGGNTISYKGVGVDNSANNRVTSVTPDCPDPSDSTLDNDGSMVVEKAQELSAGTVLTFEEIYKQIDLNATITINAYPESSLSVKLDLDKFITAGTQA